MASMFLLCIFVQKTRLFLESALFLVILMVEPARTLIIVLMTMFCQCLYLMMAQTALIVPLTKTIVTSIQSMTMENVC